MNMSPVEPRPDVSLLVRGIQSRVMVRTHGLKVLVLEFLFPPLFPFFLTRQPDPLTVLVPICLFAYLPQVVTPLPSAPSLSSHPLT